MARNGSGTYTLPPSNPVISGTVIESEWANDTMADIATALTQSISYNGETVPIANLPMGGFHHLNVSDPTARNQYATLGMVQDSRHVRLQVTGGVDNVTGVLPGGATAYVAGALVTFFAPATNTGAMTLDYNGIGPRGLVSNSGLPLTAGQVVGGSFILTYYDGTQFKILSNVAATVAAALLALSTTGQERPGGGAYAQMTIATGTSINVPAGRAWIVPPNSDSPDDATEVTWNAQTVNLTFLATSFTTTIAVNDLGAIVQFSGRTLGAALRSHAVLGVVEHITGIANSIVTKPTIFADDGYRTTDTASLMTNTIISGGLIAPNGVSPLQLDISAGSIFMPGGSANTVANPNVYSIAQQANLPFRTLAGQNVVGAVINNAPVTQYDPNGSGVVTTLPNNGDTVIHRLYYLYGNYIWVYGQKIFTSVENALSFIEWDRTQYKPSLFLMDATLVGEIVAQKNTANLANIAQAAIVAPGGINFSIGSPGGISEAPIDGFPYGRQNAAWVRVLRDTSPSILLDASITGPAPTLNEVLSPVAAGTIALRHKSGAFNWFGLETVNPDDKTYLRSYNPADGTLRHTITFDLATGGFTIPQHLTFAGLGARIRGPFGVVPINNRPMFQSSVVNDGTSIGALPNGTGGASSFIAFNSGDPLNSAFLQMLCTATATSINSFANGAGVVLPFVINVNGQARFHIEPVNSFVNIGITGDLATTNAYRLSVVTDGNDNMGMFTYSNADGPAIRQFRARGSQAAPTGVVSGDVLGGLRGGGRTNAGAFASGKGAINFLATETFTGTANGTDISFQTTLVGSTTAQETARLTGNGSWQCWSMEVGRIGVASATYIDFHTGVANVDYDTRIQSDTATGAVGGGKMSYIALGGHIFTGGINTLDYTIVTGGYASRRGTANGAAIGQPYNYYWNNSFIEAWIGTANIGNVTVTCDYRTKKDIQPLGSMWNRVKALRPISYTQAEYTPEGMDEPLFEDNSEVRWSFLAHELQETLLPTAATGVKDAPDTIQAPNPMVVIAALTKALQEAMARIEALEAKVGG